MNPRSLGFPLPGLLLLFYGLLLLTLAYYRRLLLVAMGASLLVFIIYAALFHNYILLFLPVGAEFQQLIADANSSSILVSPSSTTTSTAVPTAQSMQNVDSSITQSIKTIQTRRISSIIGTIKSPKSISAWWVLRNRVIKILMYSAIGFLPWVRMENGQTMKSIIQQAAPPVVEIGRLKFTGIVFVSSQLSVGRRLSLLINFERSRNGRRLVRRSERRR